MRSVKLAVPTNSSSIGADIGSTFMTGLRFGMLRHYFGAICLFCAIPMLMFTANAQTTPSANNASEGTASKRQFILDHYSDLASPQSKLNLQQMLDGPNYYKHKANNIAELRDIDALPKRVALAVLRKSFHVTIRPGAINGVPIDVVEPSSGIPRSNRHRVLINLHGGGFQVDGGIGGQVEAVPIAALSKIRVIAVDYRQGPEHEFPAASEDVASVYRGLLTKYRPENIGIYGCSAGGILTAESLAWFQFHKLPRPGAAGIFGAGGLVDRWGDSKYMSSVLWGSDQPVIDTPPFSKLTPLDWQYYFRHANMEDPLVNPADALSVLKLFPPTLIISGTRDHSLSAAVYTHSRLIDAGVDAELHIGEGQTHCIFAGYGSNPAVPEQLHAWNVIARFFETHLSTKAALPVGSHNLSRRNRAY